MSLEERLRLMMVQDDDNKPKTAAEQQRERRMRRAIPRERSSVTPEREHGQINIHEDEDTLGDMGDFQLPQRISRESILRKVNGQDAFGRESDYNFSSPIPSSSPERPNAMDPDVPIPSTEDVSIVESEIAEDSVIIKAEDEDDVDLYSITDMYDRTESRDDQYDEIETMVQSDLRERDDAESQYSEPTPTNPSPELSSAPAVEEGPPTPRPTSPIQNVSSIDSKDDKRIPLPEFSGFLTNTDFGLSLQSYMTPSPPPIHENIPQAKFTQSLQFPKRPTTPKEQTRALPKPEYDGSGWGPEEYDEEDEEPGTPDSVIRHPMPLDLSPPRDSPAVEEHVATIKSASGSRLKTRPSATPSDLHAMREARRQISGEVHSIPPIPERHRNRPSLNLDREASRLSYEDEEYGEMERKQSFKKKSLTLDIGGDLGLSLDKDFDRVIEAQKVGFNLSSYPPEIFQPGHGAAQVAVKTCLSVNTFANTAPQKQRGYLMRQNTKVVVASSDDKSRGTRSAGNSPIKQDRPQSWTVEPWNGNMRRKSTRDNGSPRKKTASGPAPPLPGQESNVHGLGSLAEEDAAFEPSAVEGGERGRLFVKVIGVKDLDLPLPKSKSFKPQFQSIADIVQGERSWFSLTLDNGVHCVTTAWLELGKNAPIGQEFELVVPNDLEFQLTLNAKLDKPAPKRAVESPTKFAKPQKSSTFSRVFASPKKRKEMEMRQKEEEQRLAEERQREAAAKRISSQPTSWDLLSPLAAEDGSFGRSYVCLKDHEAKCYGRPYVVDVASFNEWATDEVTALSSVKSKRGNTHVQRRAPYKIGKLELQLLFVPKPKGAKDDDMPKSMNSCIREMKEAELAIARSFEGHLSQQGGDCPVSLTLTLPHEQS